MYSFYQQYWLQAISHLSEGITILWFSTMIYITNIFVALLEHWQASCWEPVCSFRESLFTLETWLLEMSFLALSPAGCSAFGEVCSNVTVLVWIFLLFYLYAYNVRRGDISKVIHGCWEMVYFGASQKDLDNSVTVLGDCLFKLLSCNLHSV